MQAWIKKKKIISAVFALNFQVSFCLSYVYTYRVRSVSDQRLWLIVHLTER